MSKRLIGAMLAAAAVIVTTPVLTHRAEAASAARDQIVNPEYANWSKFKVGTKVKLRIVSDTGGQRNETIKVITLTNLTNAGATLDVHSTMNYGGAQMPPHQDSTTIPAMIDRQAPDAGAPRATTGDDTLTIAGKSYRAKWTQTSMEQGGIRTTMKVWKSDDFPGMTVKQESRMEGSVTGTTATEVVECNIVR